MTGANVIGTVAVNGNRDIKEMKTAAVTAQRRTFFHGGTTSRIVSVRAIG